MESAYSINLFMVLKFNTQVDLALNSQDINDLLRIHNPIFCNA